MPAAMPGPPAPPAAAAAPTIGDPRWLPHAHATITNAMAHSLACLHLWDDMHHATALLRRDADTLNEHARSIDQHMTALDKQSRRLARQEDKLARRAQRLDRAMAQFDAARAAWCRAAGLPSDTYAVQPAEDGDDGSCDASDSEDDDEDEAVDEQRDADAQSPSKTPAPAPTTANSSMVGGLVGSAWKSLDRAYAVRSKLGAVPLVGSLVQSALPENEEDTNPPDSQVSAPAAAAVAPPATLPYAPYAPYYLYYPGAAGGGAITPPTSIPDGSPRAPSVSTTSRVRSAAGAVLRRAASVASLSLGSSTPAANAANARTTSPTPTHAAMYPYYAPPHAHAHAHAHMMYAAPPAMPYAPAAYTPPQVHPAPTVDELGHLVQSMASVASVANSVTAGAASPAGVVKSVGGWALNKVLGGGSKAGGGSTTGAATE
ncbi:hypothetical protein GGF32_002278 [Allomyces javanicus]|nr:hypothetical protein GGF32_002278 [Allomyces javanicus]